MKKVLFLINHAGKGGTEKYVLTLLKTLHKKKIEAYFAYNEEGLLKEWVEELGIKPQKLEMKNPYDFCAALKLKKYCNEIGIDIIHTQFIRENYIAMWSKLFGGKHKVFYTNHLVMDKNKWMGFANRLTGGLQDQLITVCNKGKEMMIENGMNPNKIEVIFNGTDVSYWGTPVQSTLREEFQIGEDEFVFLSISRFTPDKGHRFLIHALALLKGMATKKFKCVLTNDGPLLEECRALVKELGLSEQVIFTGFRTDVKNLFYGVDLQINSSEREALSFAIIEGLASRVPVIATNTQGNVDIVNEETKCGILVDYNDVEGFARGMKKLMEEDELRLELKNNALKVAYESFNLDKMVERTYNLYQNC